jgi:hypothetical protein
MSTLFIVIAAIAGLLTLASLVAGLFGMATGGPFNDRYANLLMRGRILFQTVTVLALFALFAT